MMHSRTVGQGWLCWLAFACAGWVCTAAEIAYDAQSGETDLTSASAWVGGVVPGAGDVAVFDGTLPGTLNLGLSTEWAGVVRTNATGQLTLQAPVGGSLTLGAAGWRTHSTNLDFNRMYLKVDVLLAEDQEWSWMSNKTPGVIGSLGGTGRLSLAVQNKDANSLLFEGPVTNTGGIAFTVNLYITALGQAYWNQHLALRTDEQFILVPGFSLLGASTPNGAYAFSDIFPTRGVDNGGIFYFGGPDANGTWKDVPYSITLSAGDSLTGPSDLNVSSRSCGMVHVQNADVVNDGADVSGNVWFRLRNGSWTQRDGSAFFNYAALIGRGSPDGYGLARQRFTLEGGTWTCRRVSLGIANGDLAPAEFVMTGGEFLPSLDSDSGWATTFGIGQRTASGDELNESLYASGRAEICGGRMKVHGVTFGNPYAGLANDTRCAARFALRGGTLELGKSGLKAGPSWKEDALTSSDRSWYECVFSGGTLHPFDKDCNLAANVRLSDADGGTTFDVTVGNPLSFTGSLYGSGGFRKTGSNALCLAGANDYTGRTEVVEGKLCVGMRYETAVWKADSLAATLASGTTASEWANASGSGSTVWSFKNATSIPGTEGTTAPTYVADVFGEHDGLTFNGSQSAFLTGNADQPISDKTAFTVSLVIKTEPGFTGCSGANFYEATQIFGTSISENAGRLYGLSIDDQGRLGSGMFSTATRQDPVGKTNCTMAVENLWATNSVVNDGKPHVVFMSWQFKGDHLLQVDDQVYRCSSPSNLWNKTAKTRIVLGVGEQQSNRTKRFRGAIADLRMKDSQIGAESRADLVRQLGVRYGVEAFAGQSEYPCADATPSTETVPAATATWQADTLTQTAGQSVSAWPEMNGKGNGNGSPWTFNTTIAESVMSSRNTHAFAPVIAADTVNGHKLVSFNGTNACLALTGASATPVGEGNGLTVAAVVRFTGYGIGVTNWNYRTSGHFLSSELDPDQKVCWGMGLNAAARFTGGAVTKQNNSNKDHTIKSRRRFLNDGNLHVIVLTIPKIASGGSLGLTVDGVTHSFEISMSSSTIKNTRVLLGGSEVGGVGRFVPVDVAEFAFWKGTELTSGQIETLTRGLCEKYGVWPEGYERFATGTQQRSREIFVHAGAQYGGVGSHDFVLYPGQAIWGDGETTGRAIVLPGAYVKATCTNTFTMANVEFAGGGLEAAFTAGGQLQPITVAGDVDLPAGEVPVKVTAPDGMIPGGTVLTWTGTLVVRPSTTFVIQGALAKRLTVKLDETGRRIRIVSTSGSILIIR